MAKNISYICTSCDTTYPAWQGQCSSCGMWNTIVRQNIDAKVSSKILQREIKTSKIELNENDERVLTSQKGLNKILGEGLVKGQVVLFAGEPGIGKSTLLLQVCQNSLEKILFISGEESISQVQKRALRSSNNSEVYNNCEFSNDVELGYILNAIQSKDFDIIILDSIQTVYSDEASGFTGSMNQIRECSEKIIRAAKSSNVIVIMVGQITKEGSIAGPKILEHMVDTVLYFEGDLKNDTRILRVYKNRFGPTNEIAVYEMSDTGLAEVKDMERYFSGDINNEEGVAYSIYSEGSNYFIIEVQALCNKTTYSYPKRVAQGIDSKRLELLVAIMNKKMGLKLDEYDIFVSIVGGLKVSDTSADLAVAAAIMSSVRNKKLPPYSCFIGELSLIGEIRQVNRLNERIKKATQFGFKKIYSAKDTHWLTDLKK